MGTVRVQGLGKAYKSYPTRWSRLLEWVLPFGSARHQDHWVLKDLNFTIGAGESVGIAGVNGAGKSTLLKLITGTSVPSAGHIEVKGRVAALLELGMGFHPDFTGRQNAFMAGQLLGLSMEKMEALMPKIEAFAEIGKYIDQPVRTYSSGMQVRLAFSVATADRPDVLIVDEALSVGDAYFQHKSFDRIRQFREAGTTLLIVSHNRAAIQSICDRAILINNGRVEMEGKPEMVMDYYHALMSERQGELIRQKILSDGSTQTVSGTGEVAFDSIRFVNERDESRERVLVGQKMSIKMDVVVKKAVPSLVVGFIIKDALGQMIYGVNTTRYKKVERDLKPGDKISVDFAFNVDIGKGNYSISVALTRSDSHLDKTYEWRDRALVFSVINAEKEDFEGSCWLGASLNVKRMDADINPAGKLG
jgi:lipopolysaccharide transport system ATP-binding protein